MLWLQSCEYEDMTTFTTEDRKEAQKVLQNALQESLDNPDRNDALPPLNVENKYQTSSEDNNDSML